MNSSFSMPRPRSRLLRALLFLFVVGTTVVALFYAIENWRGRRMWQDYLNESAKRGEVLDQRSLVKPPIPDGENFAANPVVSSWFARTGPRGEQSPPGTSIVSRAEQLMPRPQTGVRVLTDFVALNEAVVITKTNGRTRVARSATWNESGQSNAARRVLAELSTAEPMLAQLRAVQDRPSARYPIEFLYDEPFSILLPHLNQLRDTTRVLKVRASASLAVGDTESALADIMLSLRIIESLKEEPLLISQLLRIACFNITTQPIWEGLVQHRWSPEQCAALQARVASLNFPAALPQSMRFERAAGVATIETVRRNRIHLMYLDPADRSTFEGYAVRLAPSGWFYMEKANYARLFDDLMPAIVRQPFDPLSIKQEADKIDKLRGGPRAVLEHRVAAALLMPSFAGLAIKAGAAHTTVDQVVTACALERFRHANGSYPETLDQLVPDYLKAVPADLFAKAPMKFTRRSSDSYLLYSIGADGKDDGGAPGKALHEQRTGDWIWHCP